MQREDHKADADHIVHDLQRDDEHDRNTGHTVMLKEADVCLFDRVGAELRGVVSAVVRRSAPIRYDESVEISKPMAKTISAARIGLGR